MALARADFVTSSLTKDEANKLIADLTYCFVDSKMFKVDGLLLVGNC